MLKYGFLSHKMYLRGYPWSWPKVRTVLKRLTGYHCEMCGAYHPEPGGLSVHHKGAPFANRPGSARDKHDIRRENLQVLCCACHEQADEAQRGDRRLMVIERSN